MIKPMEVSLTRIHASVAAKNYSYEQLMLDTLSTVRRLNPSVNAIVALQDESELLAQARQADQTPAIGALHGIPMALKDLVNVAGIVSTFGSPLLKNSIPTKDDVIAERLRRAGAIIIGKTNTPEFGFGSQTYNTVYGATASPYDISKTSGGSSGGAAAALASGMVVVADGSDMMGSLRNPAAFCNVYGFRPTYGLVPNEPRGDIFMHQLATLGPMARNIEDLAILLDVIAGPDRRHPHSLPVVSQFETAIKSTPKNNQRIGWLADWSGSYPTQPGVLQTCEKALAVFSDAGHQVEKIEAPFDRDKLWSSWIQLRSFAIASLLGEVYNNEKQRAQLKPEAIYEIESGLALTVKDISNASAIRAQWFEKANDLFSEYDILVLPSSQVFPFDKTVHWPETINGQIMDTYHRWMEVVIPASLIGLPALNVPAGFSENGLPMGMQLIGPRMRDTSLMQLAQQYHMATQWPQKRPPKIV